MMNAAIHPLQFDLFDVPVLLTAEKSRLMHSTVVSRHVENVPEKPLQPGLPQAPFGSSREFRKVVAMAKAHETLGFHERSLVLLTTLARIDIVAASDWYGRLPERHHLHALWKAFKGSRLREHPSMFTAFAIVAEPGLRTCVTQEDFHRDTSGTLLSACNLVQQWIDKERCREPVKSLSNPGPDLVRQYASRMASVALRSIPRKARRSLKQTSTL
jgi:hypothetical protein